MTAFPPCPEFVAVPIPGLGVSVTEKVVSQSFTGGENPARYVQVQLANGRFLWLSPSQYELIPA